MIKVLPGLCVDVNVTTPELSAAVGSVQLTVARFEPASVLALISAGVPLIVGSSLSKD